MKRKAPLQGKMGVARVLSPYDQMLLSMVEQRGGFNNAHGHLDRADTLDAAYLSHINTTPLEASSLPLRAKQSLTGDLHRGIAYTADNLGERMSRTLDRLIAYGTTRFCTCIDATPDISEDGLLAMRIALELKEKYKDLINLEIGPSPIFGFKTDSRRWEVFVEASKMEGVSFISGLPEKDDYVGLQKRDGRVGFRKHIEMLLRLGCELGTEVHLHLDQANDPNEAGTETLLEGLGWLDQPKIPDHEGPTVWAIHMISPSCYDENRFKRLVDGLLKYNVGVIVCPTAAVSMRQLRPINSPTHNSIARVLELCKSRVPVLIGTDNICDVYVPQSDGDLLTELKMLGHVIRFATPHVLASLGAGVPLNEVDRTTIGEVLYQDRRVYSGIDSAWVPAVD